MLPRVSAAAPSMRTGERSLPCMEELMSKTAPARESVHDGELARAVKRVHAEQAGFLGRKDPLHLALRVILRGEPHDAVDREARAVERRADLRRTVQRAVVPVELARGPRAARI